MDRRTAEPIDAAEITRLVARARGAASRIEEHVAAVVNVHRVGANNAAPGALDLAREVDTALSLASARLQAIQVRRGYRGPLPATVPQDPLHHVLANILDNAIKAMPEGGPLDVDVRRAEAAWIVAVTDSGAGLASRIVYTATASGNFYLGVSDAGTSIGTYSLAAATVGGPEDVITPVTEARTRRSAVL